MENFNRQYFSDKDVEAGLHIKFIQFLLANFESNEYRIDMHVYHEDCGAVIVEWIRQSWSHLDEMGSFQFVDADKVVVQEVQFPDGHYDYARSNEEAAQLLKAWRESAGEEYRKLC